MVYSTIVDNPSQLGMRFLQDINPLVDQVAKTVGWSGITNKVIMTGSLWHEQRQVDIVSLELLPQIYQSGSVTSCW